MKVKIQNVKNYSNQEEKHNFLIKKVIKEYKQTVHRKKERNPNAW